MLDLKKKSLQGIMDWADSKAFGGLKKKGAPAAVEVDVEGSPGEEAKESPAEEHKEVEVEMTPEMISALEDLLAQAKSGGDKDAAPAADMAAMLGK